MIVRRNSSRPKKIPLPKPKVTHEVFYAKDIVEVAREVLRKPTEVTVHPLLAVPYAELKPHQQKKVDLWHEFEGNIKLDDIFVDPKNGVELYRTSSGTWATSPGY